MIELQPPAPPAPPLLVTVDEAARLLSVSRTIIQRLQKEGKLPRIYVGEAGHVTRIPYQAILDYVEARMTVWRQTGPAPYQAGAPAEDAP